MAVLAALRVRRLSSSRMVRFLSLRPIMAIALVLLLSSCGMDRSVPSTLHQDDDFMELLAIARHRGVEPNVRYAALEPVISRSRDADEIDWVASLLGRTVERHPGDPYGAYYLMALAEGARQAGSEELALDYLRRLLKNYPDLEIRGRSLHLIAMGQIAAKTDDPREAIAMRRDMQRRFPDRIDPGRNLYALASEYRKIGMWTEMYAAWEEFLDYPDTVIPGVPDARTRVMAGLAFHNSDKSWTMESLDDLVNTVKYAIRTQDVRLLNRYQAENFFLMNWSQETSDSFTHIPMTLGSFLKSSIRYRQDLEEFSNDREAYLWTAGWTWKIPTWYLYFRRIDYPADPEINGRWEWAGIYFGERL